MSFDGVPRRKICLRLQSVNLVSTAFCALSSTFCSTFRLFAQIFVYIFHLSPPSVHFFSVAFLSWKISLLAFKSITCPLLDLSKVFLLNKLGDKSCVYFQDDETFYLKLKFFRNPCCLFLGLSHHDSLTRGFCQDFLLPKHVYSLINI